MTSLVQVVVALVLVLAIVASARDRRRTLARDKQRRPQVIALRPATAAEEHQAQGGRA